jgi:hypothetical protein
VRLNPRKVYRLRRTLLNPSVVVKSRAYGPRSFDSFDE